MAKQFDSISDELQEFIQKQHIFFVGTAMAEGRVNVSPKGMDTLRVLGPNHLIWLNLTGSGNETAIHLSFNDRMTIMFCAFDGKPLILRLYGNTIVHHVGDGKFDEYMKEFDDIPGKRQIMSMEIDLVQTSCGFAVPYMDFNEERTILKDWAGKQGEEGIRRYWKEKNTTSLDGHTINAD